MSIIDELRIFFMSCPFLGVSEHGFVMVGIDHLAAQEVNYSIESMGGSVWKQRFLGANAGIKQLNFVFASMERYSPEYLNNIINLEFYDNLNNWIETTKPPIPMIRIELTRPQLQFINEGEDLARYQIIGTLLYNHKGA